MLEVTALYTLLFPSLWTSFAAYALWYFTSAKHYAPLTEGDFRTLREIHRQKAHCRARHCQRIVRDKKLVGFKCGCGYKHVQKRPIV